MEEIEETDSNQQLCNKLIEEIMAECGDLILKIFHKQNLTYSRGINFENLLDIIRESHDQESEIILNKIQKKFMEKIINNFISGFKKNKKENKENNVKNENINKNLLQKKEIKCLECREEIIKKMNYNSKDNNIFNSVDREQLYNVLILPNNYGFNEKKEAKTNIKINDINIGKNIINET